MTWGRYVQIFKIFSNFMMFNTQSKITWAIGGALVSILITTTSWSQTIGINRVLVIVDSEAITLSEYKERHHQERIENTSLAEFSGEVNPEILDRMVNEQIQVAQAEVLGITVNDQEIDGAVQFIAQQNSITPESLIKQLKRDGFSYQQFRESLLRQQLVRKLVDVIANSRVVITDQQIENYLMAHEELAEVNESFEVSHLFILTEGKTDTEVEAEKTNIRYIRNLVLEGEPFDGVVKNYSDSSNREDGGYLGWRNPDQLPELFLNALQNMSLEENNISEVLESENGLHLLKLHDRRGTGKVVTQQQIRHILLQPSETSTDAEVLALADQLYQQLINGESFEKLARLHSKDAQSRNNGGSLGWVNPGTLVPTFEKVARSLPLNTISTPVRTQFGYHIIQVQDRRDADMTSELAANKARQALFQRKAEELYDNWFQTIRQKAFVEYVGF